MSAPTITVVVPATDQPPTLERCLEAIRDADRAPERARRRRPPAGRRAGARPETTGGARAEADVVAFVDADVVVHRDAFARIREAFADPGLDALVRLLRRRARGARAPCPAFATSSTTTSTSGRRARRRPSGRGSGRSGARPSWRGRLRRRALPARRRSRTSSSDCGSPPPGRGSCSTPSPGHPPQGWTLAATVRTDFARRGVPWVELLMERREVPDRPQPRVAPPCQRRGLGGGARRGGRAPPDGGRGLRGGARDAQPPVLRPAAAPPRRRTGGCGRRAARDPPRRRGGLDPGRAGRRRAVEKRERALSAGVPAPRGRLGLLRSRLRGRVARARAPERAGQILLAALAKAKPGTVFIEIGANDGKQEDHLAPYIRRHGWSRRHGRAGPRSLRPPAAQLRRPRRRRARERRDRRPRRARALPRARARGGGRPPDRRSGHVRLALARGGRGDRRGLPREPAANRDDRGALAQLRLALRPPRDRAPRRARHRHRGPRLRDPAPGRPRAPAAPRRSSTSTAISRASSATSRSRVSRGSAI